MVPPFCSLCRRHSKYTKRWSGFYCVLLRTCFYCGLLCYTEVMFPLYSTKDMFLLCYTEVRFLLYSTKDMFLLCYTEVRFLLGSTEVRFLLWSTEVRFHKGQPFLGLLALVLI